MSAGCSQLANIHETIVLAFTESGGSNDTRLKCQLNRASQVVFFSKGFSRTLFEPHFISGLITANTNELLRCCWVPKPGGVCPLVIANICYGLRKFGVLWQFLCHDGKLRSFQVIILAKAPFYWCKGSTEAIRPMATSQVSYALFPNSQRFVLLRFA